MPAFSERIKHLRISNNLMQKDLSALLGVTTLAYQRYEYGDREPNFNKLIKLCSYFNVSADYLLGLTNDPRRH